MKLILEACVNSGASAFEAYRGGADRVELCENMTEGGCTPSAGTIRFVRETIRIPLMVMIRPRGADFLYTNNEYGIMQNDVLMAKELHADGVVFGILKPNGTIDTERMGHLIELARPMQVTCHRAFDMTSNPFKALEDLISLGVDRVLTSGQADSALLGAGLISDLVRLSEGRIVIMPGHGIKEHNLAEAVRKCGASEYHLYLPKKVSSNMKFKREDVKMGRPSLSEYGYDLIDHNKIRQAKRILQDASQC